MMSGGGRTKLPSAGGTVVLSVDLELDLEHHASGLPRRLDEVRSELIELAGKASIPVTWAVADPMLSAATEPILRAGGSHEIAVVGDEAWLGPGCGHDRLARELVRRFAVPCKAGIPVHTLVTRNVTPLVELDLLLASGVTAVCGPAADTLADIRQPSPLRFGIWQAPPAWRLPPQATWWSPTAWQIRREIKRVCRRGSIIHLRLDALSLVDQQNSPLPLVNWLFAYLGKNRDAGRIELATIGMLATAALGQRAGAPSRSALRAA
jgi:hypothetical protein